VLFCRFVWLAQGWLACYGCDASAATEFLALKRPWRLGLCGLAHGRLSNGCSQDAEHLRHTCCNLWRKVQCHDIKLFLRKCPRAPQMGACIVWDNWSISSAGEVERSRRSTAPFGRAPGLVAGRLRRLGNADNGWSTPFDAHNLEVFRQ
jgi:hypothetical protein